MHAPLLLLSLALAATVVTTASAQEGSPRASTARYRAYVLEARVETVRQLAALAASSVRTLHTAPSLIQELEWRAPYVSSRAESADPVHSITFSFVDDALFQIRVDYDADRTVGLTDQDLLDAFAADYGAPTAASPGGVVTDLGQVVLAEWRSPGASVTLLRGLYSSSVQLLVVSPASSNRARLAVADALERARLDAPQREQERRATEAAEAEARRDAQRVSNKTAFRP